MQKHSYLVTKRIIAGPDTMVYCRGSPQVQALPDTLTLRGLPGFVRISFGDKAHAEQKTALYLWGKPDFDTKESRSEVDGELCS